MCVFSLFSSLVHALSSVFPTHSHPLPSHSLSVSQIWDASRHDIGAVATFDHPRGVSSVCAITDTVLASACDDRQVWVRGCADCLRCYIVTSSPLFLFLFAQIWDLRSNSCIRRLGHRLDVYSLTMSDGVLVSGSVDNTLKVCCVLCVVFVLSFRVCLCVIFHIGVHFPSFPAFFPSHSHSHSHSHSR